MLDMLSGLRIDGIGFVGSVLAIAVLLAVALMAAGPAVRMPGEPGGRRRKGAHPARRARPAKRRRWWRRGLLTIAIAFAGTLLVAWLVVDVVDAFGVELGWDMRLYAAAGVSLAAFGLSVLAGGRSSGAFGRRSLALLLVLASLAGAAAGVNASFGKYRTLDQVFAGGSVADASGLPARIQGAAHPVNEADWKPPADMPEAGQLRTIPIPGAKSGFPARPAAVYLPPAALTSSPPVLPVMIMLSGQPGDPTDLFYSGQFQATLDAFAAQHHGLAPIVVSPDQLSAPQKNPMCVDGIDGKSRTYLDTDVDAWIRANLNVATDRTAWAFGGFSQGGTCTMQIGLDLPERYGTDIVVSPELIPAIGDEESTIRVGFGGDRAAYDRASPLNVMKSHAPYSDTVLILGTGGDDKLFTMWGDQMASAAKDDGIQVTRLSSPGTSHDFHTVDYVLERALPQFAVRAGLIAG